MRQPDGRQRAVVRGGISCATPDSQQERRFIDTAGRTLPQLGEHLASRAGDIPRLAASLLLGPSRALVRILVAWPWSSHDKPLNLRPPY